METRTKATIKDEALCKAADPIGPNEPQVSQVAPQKQQAATRQTVLSWGSRGLLLILLSSLVSLVYISIIDQKLFLQMSHPHSRHRDISILLWHWPFGHSYRLGGDKCLELYNISRCFLTDDTSTFSTADVVVFHHQELSRGLISLPLHLDRPASQHWVWLSMEPPANNANLTRLNGLFNWTMSYRQDADIPIPYGKTVSGADRHGIEARAKLYQTLKQYIPINVYGTWNKRPLSKRKLLPTIANSGPKQGTYEALAPPGSFIHVEDFSSPAALAAHLKHTAADRRAYDEYFQWHQSHRVQAYTDWRERLCQICVRYPHLAARKTYRDLEAWVNG
ncbi:Alpha-(1,3)-fucosyltransferase 7 [Takifugu flavidus]|uniref:Fucosyltransferase n=1 Tax=Takifugu flavidus TaxID=433684 RepID=A0A5C6N6B0_9TELE|nr:Alpha-(1,3)-fucosyltransferase 7 [Takifugu flavidus]